MNGVRYSLIVGDDETDANQRLSMASAMSGGSDNGGGYKIQSRLDRRKERLNAELLAAAFRGDLEQVVSLIRDSGASCDATCRSNRVSVLHLAALRGDSLLVDFLLTCGANPSLRDRDGRLPFHLAAWSGHVHILRSLLASRPDIINAPIDPDGELTNDLTTLDSWNHDHDLLNKLIPECITSGSTALHLASSKAHCDCVEFLLDEGANVDVRDKEGLTPLDVSGIFEVRQSLGPAKLLKAVVHSRSQVEPQQEIKSVHRIVNALITNGAKLPQGQVILKEGAVKNQTKMNVTTLHTAVGNEDLDLIQCLLDKGASLTTWNGQGDTPLHLAVRRWLLEPLKCMINHDKSCVDVRDNQGRTPLHLAVIQEWPNGVELLLEMGADTRKSSNTNETVLHLAAERGSYAILQELLSIPESLKVLEYRNDYYNTPLCRAVEAKHLNCVQLLCEHGADRSISLPGDITLLHIAAWRNSPDIIEFLLIDPDVARSLRNVRCREERGGLTALHIAAQQGFTECVERLLKGGCDVLCRTLVDDESTPLHLASRNGNLDAVMEIVRFDGKVIDVTDKSGWTPLHVAAGNGHGDCVTVLLRSGADLAASVSENGGRKKTALDIIMHCVSKPIDLLEKVADSSIEANRFSLTDAESKVTLKYGLLVPGCRSSRQLRVLNAILNNGKESLQARMLLHPLVETFIYLKWKRLRFFFMVIMTLYMTLTFSLTILAHLMYVEQTNVFVWLICADVARTIMLSSLLPIIILEMIHASQLQRYYFMDCESWVKWAGIVCALTVGIVSVPRMMLSPWAHYITSVAVLLAWIELLFMIARCPKWGFYVLMFTKVASNVFKVLLSFSCLMLGFAFSFLILFQARDPFPNFFTAIIKVMVMTLEFDYENMFAEIQTVTTISFMGRIVFLSFMILVSIVMMNLMVGLAVADIAELEAQGKTQRLAKQIAFLNLLELCLYNRNLKKLVPKRYEKDFDRKRAVPESTVIHPGRPLHKDLIQLPKSLRDAIIERVWTVHKTNDDNTQTSINLQDINNKIDQLAEVVNKRLMTCNIAAHSAPPPNNARVDDELKALLKSLLEERTHKISQSSSSQTTFIRC